MTAGKGRACVVMGHSGLAVFPHPALRATLPRRGRVFKPLSPRERGWGEGRPQAKAPFATIGKALCGTTHPETPQ